MNNKLKYKNYKCIFKGFSFRPIGCVIDILENEKKIKQEIISWNCINSIDTILIENRIQGIFNEIQLIVCRMPDNTNKYHIMKIG